jgi:protoheme IX farnesyltransferase
MVFLWQFPHFMAIAWMYREDYSRAGYLVLPAGELRNRFVVWQSFVGSLALIPLSLIPTISGESGLVYSCAALIMGSIFFYYSVRFAFHRSNVAARQLLAASVVYLPWFLFSWCWIRSDSGPTFVDESGNNHSFC